MAPGPYASADELMAEVDAVSIALPPDVQVTLAEQAARRGRHLLLDKPIALTVADADRLVATVEAAGVASVVFFTRRFIPSVAAFVDGGGAVDGAYDGARVVMFSSIFDGDNPYGASPWRREWGALWDTGPHALSLLLPVFGPVGDIVGT